jgi:hypothetical protein
MSKFALGLVRPRSHDVSYVQDCSTQGLKASLVELGSLVCRHTFAINYDRDLPEFGTVDGVHRHPGGAVTAPTIMVALRIADEFDLCICADFCLFFKIFFSWAV